MKKASRSSSIDVRIILTFEAMMRTQIIFLLSTILCVIVHPSATEAQTQAEKITQIFRKFGEYEFQGAILVANQEEVYQQAFGLANREWNVANTLDTKFDIASLSKQFTAALVLQLVAEGQMHLDSTISTYYSAYRPDVGRRVTIHQLLTHQSGIPNYTNLPYVWSDSLALPYTSEQLVEKFGSGDLEFEPGTRYQYNNTGYYLLSLIIEAVSGQPFATVLQERILTPLGLQQTGVDDRTQVLERRAYGYEKTTRGFYNATPMHMANLQGAGNMYATVEDLHRWTQALFGAKLFPEKQLEAMTQPYTDQNTQWIPPYESRYGYGLGVATVPLEKREETKMLFHSGHIKGFSSFMAYFPETALTVIMLGNTGNISTARMNEMVQLALKAYLGLPYELPRRDLAAMLYQVVQQEGTAAALDHYYYLKNAFPYEFKSTLQEIDDLGLRLEEEGKVYDALEMFKLNRQVNPNWQTYYRLGVAYQRMSQLEEAEALYQESLTLNPRKTSAQRKAYSKAKQALKEMK